MPRMREDGRMKSRTAFLAILPAAVAVLAGAALPFQGAAAGHVPEHPLWSAAACGIIALAVLLLLRLPAAAAPPR